MASRHVEEFQTTRNYEKGPRRDTAIRFLDLSQDLDRELPDGDDKDSALRLLLEARDCAIRASAALLRPGSVVDS